MAMKHKIQHLHLPKKPREHGPKAKMKHQIMAMKDICKPNMGPKMKIQHLHLPKDPRIMGPKSKMNHLHGPKMLR